MWHLLQDDMKMLTVRREPRQMLTLAEKQRLFETAASRTDWQRAYCAALLTANGSMRPIKLRQLLWCDFDPVTKTLTIQKSKTEAGTRVIPLNDEAWAAVTAMKQSDDKLETYAFDNLIFHRE
jgi:integrase